MITSLPIRPSNVPSDHTQVSLRAVRAGSVRHRISHGLLLAPGHAGDEPDGSAADLSLPRLPSTSVRSSAAPPAPRLLDARAERSASSSTPTAAMSGFP